MPVTMNVWNGPATLSAQKGQQRNLAICEKGGKVS